MRPGGTAAGLETTKIFLLIIFFLFWPEILPAAEGDRHRIYIDEELQMELADHLFKGGDYYRAITEYKRFLFSSPKVAGPKKYSGRLPDPILAGRGGTKPLRPATTG